MWELPHGQGCSTWAISQNTELQNHPVLRDWRWKVEGAWMQTGYFHAWRVLSHQQGWEKGKKPKIPHFPCTIQPRNHLETGCKDLLFRKTEWWEIPKASITRKVTAPRSNSWKNQPGHEAAAGWELASLFFFPWEILDLMQWGQERCCAGLRSLAVPCISRVSGGHNCRFAGTKRT